MSPDQYDPCRCTLPSEHDGDHQCEHGTEPQTPGNTSAGRPVVSESTRDASGGLDLDHIEREVLPRMRLDDDVMGTRIAVLAERLVAGLRAQLGLRASDAATIGTLSVAVGKVNQLHQPDEDGFCRACRTEMHPCATAKAIGVGQ